MTEFQKWFAARARNPDRITLEEAYQAGLRAKVAEMGQQFPICRVKDIKRAHYMTKVVGLDPDAWLYALHGAQPAPSVPDGWQLVPTNPTPEMREAGLENWQYGDKSISSIWYDMLAAVPKQESE